MQFRSAVLSALLASVSYAATNSTSITAVSEPSITASSTCTYSDGLTATAQSDLDALNCAVFEGNLIVEAEAMVAGSLASVQKITGDFTIQNSAILQNFAANNLIEVSGALKVFNITIMNALNIPHLYKAKSLQLEALQALQDITFQLSQCSDITISNTLVENITGLYVTDVDILDINNNGNLGSLDLQLETASTSISITDNSNSVNISLPDLVWANNITIRSGGSVDIPNLQTVNSSMGIMNTTASSLIFNNVTQIGGSLVISGNNQLTDVEFDSLTNIAGAFLVTDNYDLASITGFNQLQVVSGAATFNGSFSNATLNSIKSIRGGATINTSGDLDCSDFNKLYKQGVILGKGYVCKSAKSSTSGKAVSSTKGSASSSSGSSTDSSSSSKSTKNGAVSFDASSSIVGALAAGLLCLF